MNVRETTGSASNAAWSKRKTDTNARSEVVNGGEEERERELPGRQPLARTLERYIELYTTTVTATIITVTLFL